MLTARKSIHVILNNSGLENCPLPTAAPGSPTAPTPSESPGHEQPDTKPGKRRLGDALLSSTRPCQEGREGVPRKQQPREAEAGYQGQSLKGSAGVPILGGI